MGARQGWTETGACLLLSLYPYAVVESIAIVVVLHAHCLQGLSRFSLLAPVDSPVLSRSTLTSTGQSDAALASTAKLIIPMIQVL